MEYVFLYFLLLVCMENNIALAAEEPRCSKFDFEEKMLEKMVKMEYSTGIMMEEFRKIKTEVQEGLVAMKQELSNEKLNLIEEREKYEQVIQGNFLLRMCSVYKCVFK